MKLTIERVKAARAAITCGGCDDEACRDGVFAMLCDEWIERHTVRWEGNDLETADGRHLGAVLYGNGGVLACWGHRHEDPEESFATESEARTWLDEQARAAGFEVAT